MRLRRLPPAASLALYGVNGLSGWLFSAAGAVMLALVFAALSRAFPRDGGLYVYTRAAFGPLPAFVVAWGYWVSVWVGNAAIATGGVSYLSTLVPPIARFPGVSVAVTLALLWLLTFVNCAGVRAAGWVQAVTTVLKLLPLVAVALLGEGLVFLRHPLPGLVGGPPLGLDATTAAATLTLWALLGLEPATVPADKVENPERTVPRATIIGTVVTALICALACSVVLLLVPGSDLATSNAPFADAIRPLWGEGRDPRRPLRRHQRVRGAQRVDPASGRAALGHGPGRRLPQVCSPGSRGAAPLISPSSSPAGS